MLQVHQNTHHKIHEQFLPQSHHHTELRTKNTHPKHRSTLICSNLLSHSALYLHGTCDLHTLASWHEWEYEWGQMDDKWKHYLLYSRVYHLFYLLSFMYFESSTWGHSICTQWRVEFIHLNDIQVSLQQTEHFLLMLVCVRSGDRDF